MSLKGCKILMTVGPTQEPLDPVRYLTNGSSGEMGLRMATVLKKRGAHVYLVLGPVERKIPKVKKIFKVQTAIQMASVVKKNIKKMDAFVAAAAVSDYRFKKVYPHKLKKTKKALHFHLVKNPDILAEVGRWRKKRKKPILVGFALETKNLKSAARKKLINKKADLIIGNTPTTFNNKNIAALWVEKGKHPHQFRSMNKSNLSNKISQWIDQCLQAK